MDFLRLSAVVLLATAVGCSPTRLFSRDAPEDDFQLDPQVAAAPTLRNGEPAPAAKGNWNVVQDESSAPEAAKAPRSLASLPVSELLERAQQAEARQQLPEARRHLEAIVLQQPNHPGAHHRLAVIADLEGRFGDAEHHYKMALHSDGHNATIIGDLGYSYMLQGRLPLAEQYLVQARTLDPSHARIANNLAQLYARRGDLDSAQRVLADVLPPADLEQRLAQLFPGVSLQQTLHPAPSPLQQPIPLAAGAPDPDVDPVFAAAPQSTLLNQPSVAAAPYGATGPDYRTAMIGAPGATAEDPHVSSAPSPFHAAPPNAASPFTHGGAAAQINFDSPPHALPPVEQAVAAHSSEPGSSGAVRRWPPPLWPPEPQPPAVSQTAGSLSVASDRPKSGVNYLLPRRAATATAPSVAPAPPAGAPVPNTPWDFPPSGTPTGARPSADTSSFQSPAQYTNGPGTSRIVTWSNLNGQSIDPPPLPPTAEELRAAAALGLSGTAPPPPAVLRTSPGAASGWNGGFYPAPQRQLPGGPNLMDYPQQGAPIRAPAIPGPAANMPQDAAMPHAGFVIAPESALPDNPLAGYEQDRRQFDQQFQQQVNQSYGQSPSGFIAPPSASIPAPRYEMRATGPQYGAAPPLTPNDTPWPGHHNVNTAGTAPLTSAPHSPPPTRNANSATPPPYHSTRVSRETIAPPAYRRQSSPTTPLATAAPSANLPSILPSY